MKRSDQISFRDWDYYIENAAWQKVSIQPPIRHSAEDWILGKYDPWERVVKCWFCHHPNPDGPLGFWDSDWRSLPVTEWAYRIAKPNKFGAKRGKSTLLDRSFDSQAERQRGELLAQLEKAGVIRDLKFQPQTYLSAARIGYKPDFRYTDEQGIDVYEDVKGVETEAFRLKVSLWREYGPAQLRIMKLSRGRWVVARTIFPPVGDPTAEQRSVAFVEATNK